MPSRHTISYLSVAQNDLFDIVDHIAEDSAKAAAAFVEEIDDRIGLLARHLKMGVVPKVPVLKSKGYRMLLVGNYLVFYVILEKKNEIRRVLHSKRSYRFLLE
jgi:plasmid stabilization system protein ParE